MIALASLLYDPVGYVVLQEHPTSDLHSIERRVSRAKTLDGEVDITDRGFTHGDRDFVVLWAIRNETEYMKIGRMVRLYPVLTMSSREGVFEVTPVRLTRDGRQGRLELMVRRKVG